MADLYENIGPGTPYPGEGGLLRPPAEATSLSAIRVLRNGSMRQYSGVDFTQGWAGVERFIRTLRAVGYVWPSGAATDGYAVLDILDSEDGIIADYELPTAPAFRYVKRKLNLTVVNAPDVAAAQETGASAPGGIAPHSPEGER